MLQADQLEMEVSPTLMLWLVLGSLQSGELVLPMAKFVTRFGVRISPDHFGGEFCSLWLM